uniref:Uncharacterized protein n=1 Tax=Anguilla anguilla TaxID=7936 RepID=A0A0E9Q4K7_ANGAN
MLTWESNVDSLPHFRCVNKQLTCGKSAYSQPFFLRCRNYSTSYT